MYKYFYLTFSIFIRGREGGLLWSSLARPSHYNYSNDWVYMYSELLLLIVLTGFKLSCRLSHLHLDFFWWMSLSNLFEPLPWHIFPQRLKKPCLISREEHYIPKARKEPKEMNITTNIWHYIETEYEPADESYITCKSGWSSSLI